MGWNSWDSFGESVSEADARANAKWMAEHLKNSGWAVRRRGYGLVRD